MRGLRKQEDSEFESFMEIVQKYAEKKGCVFFVDSGEGNEIQLPGIDGEDLSGWLIPVADADEFETLFMDGIDSESMPDKFDQCFCFAKWDEKNGDITIRFVDR